MNKYIDIEELENEFLPYEERIQGKRHKKKKLKESPKDKARKQKRLLDRMNRIHRNR